MHVSSIRLKTSGLDKIWVNISVDHGILQIPSTSNLYFTSINSTIEGVNPNTIKTTSYAKILVDGAVQYEFTGTAAAVQKSLSHIVYSPFGQYSGLDMLHLSVRSSVGGSSDLTEQTSQITVLQKNYAPHITSEFTHLTCNESSSLPITAIIQVQDISTSTFEVIISSLHGRIESSYCNVVAVGEKRSCHIQANLSAVSDIFDSGEVVYIPDTGYNSLIGPEQITFYVNDRDETAIGGNLSTSYTIDMIVAPLVTYPSLSIPTGIYTLYTHYIYTIYTLYTLHTQEDL